MVWVQFNITILWFGFNLTWPFYMTIGKYSPRYTGEKDGISCQTCF